MKKKSVSFFLFFGLASLCWLWPGGGREQLLGAVSVNMQPLCCSQFVVQWCSQTPKHVLLNLYDCTYRILFYNLCKTSLRMSHSSCGRGNVDVNIYFIAIFCPFLLKCSFVEILFWTFDLIFFFSFFAVFNKACPVGHYCQSLFIY